MSQPADPAGPVVGPRRHQRVLRVRRQRARQRPHADRPLPGSSCTWRPTSSSAPSCRRWASPWSSATSTTPTWRGGWPGGRTARTSTALPYGPSVPHMFIVIFVIMLPIYLRTQDPIRAWQAGLAWAFIIGVIVLIGAFVGPYIRKWTPRGGDARHAGRHLDHLHLDEPGRPRCGRRPGSRSRSWRCCWSAAHRRAAARQHPDRPGRAAARHGDRLDRRRHVGAGRVGGRPRHRDRGADLRIDLLVDGLGDMAPLLATAIPLGVYNFTEAMNNVESAGHRRRQLQPAQRAARRRRPARSSARRSARPFPPAVYIGHPGWKAAGGRTGYSMATGVVIALLCFLGLFGLLGAIFPTPAIVPILLYIGLVIGAQAFQASPRAHAAGGGRGARAEHRGVGDRADGQRARRRRHQRAPSGRRGAAGRRRGLPRADGAGSGRDPGRPGARCDRGLHHRQTLPARGRSSPAPGRCSRSSGLIHGEKVEWNANGQVALGYLFVAAVCALVALGRQPAQQPDADEPAPEPAPAVVGS